MSVQNEINAKDQKHTGWHAVKRWLKQVDVGLNYDPLEHAHVVIRQLSRKVEQLETRVNEVEEKRAAR